MKARTALLELFKESSEWRAFFRSCCETSALRLRSQAWQFCDELHDRGHKLQVEEVENSLLRLARNLLPESSAAQWDTVRAHALCKDVLTRLAKSYAELSATNREAVDFSTQDIWDKRMHSASSDNDPTAFGVALKGWEQAGLEAMERVRVKGGAA